MKKRNIAIRRIVECIESEYETEGEFLLWETSIPKLQKGTNTSIRTFEVAFKQLRELRLISLQDYSQYTKTYIVGFKHPTLDRTWIPSIIAKPWLVKLPSEPKQISTKFYYHVIRYQIQVELLKTGMLACFGNKLIGRKYSTLTPHLLGLLKSIEFSQTSLLRILKSKNRKPLSTKVFSTISADLKKTAIKLSFYLIENKELLENSVPQESKRVSVTKVTTSIRNTNTRIIDLVLGSCINYHSSQFVLPQGDSVTPSKSKLCINSSSAGMPKRAKNDDKQQILDGFWNARKCVFGVHSTLNTAKGHTRYSSDLPKAYRMTVNRVKQLRDVAQYPIPPRLLFMAVFTQYRRFRHDNRPSQKWCYSEQFKAWTELFVQSYDEIKQFENGKRQIGDREIDEGDEAQFIAMKKTFLRIFEKRFRTRPIDFFGAALDFHINWCVFKAILNFRIAKTQFEHRTGRLASLLAYVRAQVEFLYFRHKVTHIQLDWIYESEARLRMEHWIWDNEPDTFISRKRKEQLNQFFAQQKMSDSEQA